MLRLGLRYDISPVSEVVTVIGEEIVLFRINNRFNHRPSLLSFVLQHSHNDVHDLGDHGGEAGEDPVNDALGHLLEHEIHILKEVEGRLSQFLKLRLDQIDEHVDGWETRNRVTFMKHDCFFDVSVSVLTCCTVIDKLPI